MTRFIVILAILFLILVAADPDEYAVFGWSVGLFIMAISPFIGKLQKNAGGPVFATGATLFGIAWVGAEYYQEVRIAAAVAAAGFIVWLLFRLRNRHMRHARQRSPEERRRFQERPTEP